MQGLQQAARVLLRLSLALGALAVGALAVPAAASAGGFVDFGLAATTVDSKIAAPGGAVAGSYSDSGLHLGIGVSKAINERSDIGVRLELDEVESDQLLAFRAFDYTRHVSDRISMSYFAGAARLSLGTPAYGYYLGLGAQFKQVVAGLDLGVDLRYGDKVARDNVLPSDFRDGSPDNFFDVTGISVYLTHRF
jgi:hypothetical protein